MKQLYKIGLYAMAFVWATSCVEDPLDFKVEKPESVALQEELNAYDALKSYLDREAHAGFKLGAGVSLSEYISQGVMYRLVNRNFDEFTIGYGMKHGAVVQADGRLSVGDIEEMFSMSQQAGLTVFGHTLCWHANQNAEYLNSLIAPTEIPGTGGPTWDLVTGADFETDAAPNYLSNANAVMSFTAVGEGKGGEGRALKIVNAEVRPNDWESQFFVTFSPAMEVGEQYELSMDVRADAAASFSTQAHVVPYEYKHWDFFGTINATTEWTTFTKQITVSESVAGTGAIAFNLGNNATSYYFDNVTLKKYNPEGSGGSVVGTTVIADFETDDLDETYPMSSGGSGTVVADPKGGGSKVLNIVGVQTFPQFTVTLPAGITLGNCTTVTLDFLGTGSTGMYGQGMRMGINGGAMANYISPANYGATDNNWAVGLIVMAVADMNLTEDQKGLNSFTLALGSATGAANYFIDNIVIDWESSSNTVEKTPEEKKEIIDGELERWIAGMMEVSRDYVKAWDVVNEPMDDGDPYELKTGVGKELAPDQFYWQDYMGKDYAVRAIELARQHGNPDDILFVNDYNLEYNIDKCKGLIAYVEYIESQGVTVDGIGTQMHISIDSDKDKIAEMFQLLAATGKLIKVSELDIGVGVKTGEATDEHYLAQAGMYRYVIEKYMEIIPVAQRYGITIWAPKDSPADSFWRAGEPIGLWTEEYNRKRAYSAVAEALEGAE